MPAMYKKNKGKRGTAKRCAFSQSLATEYFNKKRRLTRTMENLNSFIYSFISNVIKIYPSYY